MTDVALGEEGIEGTADQTSVGVKVAPTEAPAAEVVTLEAPAAEVVTLEAPAAEVVTLEAPAAEVVTLEPPAAEVVTLGRWQAALLAIGSLIFVYGIALGSMYAIGSVLHAIDPSRHFDILYVLHNRIVLLVLIGVTMLWLLPPYPSAIRELKRRTDGRSHSAAADTGDGEAPVARVALTDRSDSEFAPCDEKGGMSTGST